MRKAKQWSFLISIILIVFLGIGIYIVIYGISSKIVNIDKEDYPVKGIDISSHNGSIDFKKVEEDGVSFVLIKATEGASFKDNRFESNYSGVRNTGMKVGAYHFFRFDINGTLQGMNLLNAIRGKILDLPVAIDVEEHGNPATPTPSVIKRLNEMIEHISAKGYDIMIYTNSNGYKRFIEPYFADYPLWICKFSKPHNDIEWKFWQYSHWGEVDGISGEVDLNIFNGSEKDLENILR